MSPASEGAMEGTREAMPASEASEGVLGAASDAERVLAEVRSLLDELHTGAGRPVRLESDLQRDLGLDSLGVVELYDRLEHAFSVRLSEDVLATAATPADWLHAVLEARSVASGQPVQPVAITSVRRASAEPWPETAKTLTEALAWHVEAHPDLVSIRIIGATPDDRVEDLSYGALDAEATAIAAGLVTDGLGRGERVAIMLPTTRAYFVVYLGVLLAGGVPVPIYPPARLSVLEEHLGRQARLLANAGATVLVTVHEARVAARLLRPHVPSLRAVRTPDALVEARRHPVSLPVLAPDDVALVQYTSGSTGDPKGVVLTHAQLLANVRAMGQAAAVSSSDVFVSWLPLYHDMGLIGAFLAPLFFGFPLVIMSPLVFLARPASWLEAISAYGGTLSAAPNFAYQACVDRIDEGELASLDLSSWRVAFNGSEPVSAVTVERFVGRFARCGFRREAMCPAYGLAEMGVGVAFSPLGRGPRVDTVARSALQRSERAVPVSPGDSDALAVVSCGTPLPGHELRVVDRRGDELPDRREGTVECRGPSATTGYFANEAANRALWRRGWLDTGDLGYVASGELFLTGRAKDLVIRAGRNLHPEELEQALGELHGVHRGGVAAFASTDPRLGTERLVVVVEADVEAPEERAELEERVTRKAVDLLGAAPDEVVLTAPGVLLRTASGKIRRAATRDAFEAGVLGRRRAPVLVQLVRFGWSGVGPAGRRLAGTAATWCFAAYVWTLVGLIATALWFAIHLPSSRRVRWALTRAAGRALCALSGIELRVEGTLPRTGAPAVVVSNHQSFVDGLALILTSPDPAVFVASTDLGRTPLIGGFLRRLGCVFVERGRAGRSAGEVEELAKLARDGRRIAIFPEGSIVRAPGMRPFHLGAFAAAAAANCPVIPVGIRGTRDVVRPGTYLPRRGRVVITVGSPISPVGSDFAAQIELRDAARRAIAELSGEADVR